jgi:glycosyltransferase involved in cell wall biosynthesis
LAVSRLPRISCIVPVYNGARFLAEALDSILRQTLAAAETIVVDDGSTDTTPAVVAGFGGRVRYQRQENRGPAAARNAGVRSANGEFLSFLDADDLWHPDKLSRQMARFDANPDLGLCLAWQRPFWVDEMKHEQARLQREQHPFVKDHVGYICQAMLMRRTTFDSVGPFDESLRIGEDTDWILRAQRKGIVRETLTDVLVYRRMHQNNLSYSRYGGGGEAGHLDLVFAQLQRKRQQAG